MEVSEGLDVKEENTFSRIRKMEVKHNFNGTMRLETYFLLRFIYS